MGLAEASPGKELEEEDEASLDEPAEDDQPFRTIFDWLPYSHEGRRWLHSAATGLSKFPGMPDAEAFDASEAEHFAWQTGVVPNPKEVPQRKHSLYTGSSSSTAPQSKHKAAPNNRNPKNDAGSRGGESKGYFPESRP